jgi:hypothetical protein
MQRMESSSCKCHQRNGSIKISFSAYECTGITSVSLRTDSEHVIKGAKRSEWRGLWEQNGYRNARGDPIVNKRYYLELYQAENGIDVEYVSCILPVHQNFLRFRIFPGLRSWPQQRCWQLCRG